MILNGIFAKDLGSQSYLLANFGGGYQSMTVVTNTNYAYYLEYQDDYNNIPLLPEIQKAINYLPEEYDEELYNLFIEYWGLFIVINGYAGGMAQQITNIKECYYTSGINMEDQAQLMMLKNLWATEYEHQQYTASYLQYSKADLIELYGGDPTINSTNYDQRILTYDSQYTVLVNITVVPITNFINNKKKRDNLQQAINNYIKTENNQRDTLITNWNNDWNNQRPIYYFPSFGPNLNDLANIQYYFQKWIIDPSKYTYTLGSSQSSLTLLSSSNGFRNDQYSNLIIGRDNNGSIYIDWNNAGNYPGYCGQLNMRTLTINNPNSNHLKAGCTSVSGYLTSTCSYSQPPTLTWYEQHTVCVGCNMILNSVECSDNSGLCPQLACDCPTF